MKFELSENGTLYRIVDGARRAYDFNEEYRGYYAPCRFTALSEDGGQILLAGLSQDGHPHLFLSLMGTAFEERTLAAVSPTSPPKQLGGEIFRILYEKDENQYYLICRNGEIAVMPDCPKCMRIVSTGSDRSLVEAELVRRQHGGESELCLALTKEGGDTMEIPLSSLRQYRVSWSFAEKLLSGGALLVDVREQEAEAEDALIVLSKTRGCRHIPLSRLDDFLREQPRQQVFVFICRTGRLADEAAEYARSCGFYRAFSAGGTEDWAHVE
ncbi:MAG: rhodanese-like domain-containing protein [Lachnospiraceae bacterium]|nr:rhodanese-like domain-containing protein [Lachnospiraceae bacterium]